MNTFMYRLRTRWRVALVVEVMVLGGSALILAVWNTIT